MAINFAETFLRESGATQDRAQSMAEMQLRAKQFEQNYSLALARQKVAERAQTLAEEAQDFEQTRIKNLDDLSLEDRKYYLENIQPLELEEAQNRVQQTKYTTELMKAQVDDANAVMPDDLAQELNMQKGTKWSDAEKILMGRQAIYEQRVRTRAESARANLYGARTALLERPIEEEEAFDFATEDEQIGFFGKLGRGIGSSFLDFITGTPGAEGYSQAQIELMGGFGATDTGVGPLVRDEETRQKLINLSNKLARERELGLTTEGQERIIGQSRPDLLDPISRNLYNAAITSGYFTTPANVLNTQATFDLLPQGVSFPSADMNSYLQSLLPAGPIEEE